MRTQMANKPDAVNPAMALWFAIKDQWRRVAELGRCIHFRYDTF